MIHVLLVLLLHIAVADGTRNLCLQDGIPEGDRRPAVENGPLLLASYSWENSRITAAAAQIIMEERMGLQVNRSAVLGGSHLGPPALAGGDACGEHDSFNRCDVSNPLAHYIFDAWGGGEKSYNQMNSSIQPIMGGMGYMGREGTFVPDSAIQVGLGMTPQAFMDFYKSYNSSNMDLTQFMASQAEVEAKIVELGLSKAACSRVDIPQAHSGCAAYEQFTGDYGLYDWISDGAGDELCHINCETDWIRSPACRAKPDSCVAWVTTGDGWGVEEILQQAVFWNIALAVVVLPSWGDYTTLPLEVPSLWFWFFPDPAFMAVRPTKLQEPPTDNGERATRLFRTGADAIVMRKFQWRLLPTYAPQVHDFLNKVEFSLSDVTELMTNASRGEDLDEIACRWVRNYEDKWSAWLPRADDCAPGWSYEAAEGRCTRCLAGFFSTGAGSSNISCQPCYLGSSSDQIGASECTSCDAGSVAASLGLTQCEACPSGSYSSSIGTTACSPCHGGANNHLWTTMRKLDGQWVLIDGATDQSSCGCAVGARASDNVTCVPCTTEGVTCTGMGEVYINPGYMSELSLSVYECFAQTSACPGGPPGETCKQGRFGISCSTCSEGSIPGPAGTCKVCEGHDFVIPVAALCGCFGVLAMTYVLADRRVRDPAAPSQALIMGSIAFGQLVSVVQQLSVIAYFSVNYGEPVDSFLRFFTVFAFNVEFLRIGCLGDVDDGSSQYILKVALLASAVLAVFIIHVGSTMLFYKGNFEGRRPSLIATIGVIMLALLTSIIVVILGPLQCNKHPNGKYTMASYETVLCWDFASSTTQLTMLSIGGVAMVGPLMFYSKVCQVVYIFPRKMKEMDSNFMQSYGMLFFRLRQGAHGYLVVLITRALLIALIPILRNSIAQIFILQTLLLGSQSIALIMKPWRIPTMNYLDSAFTVGMLYFSNLASFSIEDVDLKGVGYLVIVLMMLSISIVPLIFGYVFFVRCAPRLKAFQFFLCHAKAESGCFCRLLKMQMQEQPKIKREVFLDADNLDDLDKLLSYVGNDLDTLLVVLSKSTIYRAWCAGEITVAYRKGIDAVTVRLPSFNELTAEQKDNYLADCPDLECLTESGLSAQMIHQGVTWILDLPPFLIPSNNCLAAAPNLANSLAMGVTNGILPQTEPNAKHSVFHSEKTIDNKVSSDEKKEQCIGIVADMANLESCASAGIICKLLSPRILLAQKNQVTEVMLEGQSLAGFVNSLVLIGTNGCLTSIHVVNIILQASMLTLQVLPIVCEDNFAYPTPGMFKNFPEDELPYVNGTRPTRVEVALAMQDVFKEIAIVIRCRNSAMAMLNVSANEAVSRLLSRRVHTMKAVSYFMDKASSMFEMDSDAVIQKYGTGVTQASADHDDMGHRGSLATRKHHSSTSASSRKKPSTKFSPLVPTIPVDNADDEQALRAVWKNMHWTSEF